MKKVIIEIKMEEVTDQKLSEIKLFGVASVILNPKSITTDVDTPNGLLGCVPDVNYAYEKVKQHLQFKDMLKTLKMD